MGLSNALWPTAAGVTILIVGLAAVWGELFAGQGLNKEGMNKEGPDKKGLGEWLDKLIVFGPALVAASVAAFGAEHFVIAKDIAKMVPSYMPWHLFWAYFVGAALLAAGLSLAVGKCVRWSAPSLSLMIGSFVLMLSLPAVVATPRDRIAWTLTLRDSSFSLGALALAVLVWGEPRNAVPLKPKEGLNGAPSLVDSAGEPQVLRLRATRSAQDDDRRNGAPAFVSTGAGRWMILVARLVIGVTLVFYGVQYLVHPAVAAGVPLEKMTPGWVPGLRLWDYLGGVALVVGGVALLANKRARDAAAWVGLMMVVITVLLYLPIFILDPPELKMEGMNYVFDTLMFGGTMLLLAGSLRNPANSLQQPRAIARDPEGAAVPGIPVL